MTQAKWIYDKDAYDWNKGGWRCSKCGTRNNNIGDHPGVNPLIFTGSNYCPHCGSSMSWK